jgi:hypothetical protein
MSITEDQIKHMVSRFLQWRLPANFSPDAGISFTPEFNVEWNAKRGKPPQRHEPVGTNLFDAVQAEAMVRHMLEGLPSGSDSAPLIAALQRCHDVLHHCMGVLHPHDAEKASAAMAEAREAIAGASLAGDRITDLRIALSDIIALDHHWHGPEGRATEIARAALLRDDDMAALT